LCNKKLYMFNTVNLETVTLELYLFFYDY